MNKRGRSPFTGIQPAEADGVSPMCLRLDKPRHCAYNEGGFICPQRFRIDLIEVVTMAPFFHKILLLLCVMTLCAAGALAEETVHLDYAYGEAALNLHLEDKPNTVEFRGNTYIFDRTYVHFRTFFPCIGGNTQSLFEYTIPQETMRLWDGLGSVCIGNLSIDPPADMTLCILSGSRESGYYTIIREITNTRTFQQSLFATRAPDGQFMQNDLLFLYSCEVDGRQQHYAVGMYFDFDAVDPSIAAPTPVPDDENRFATAAPTADPTFFPPTPD